MSDESDERIKPTFAVKTVFMNRNESRGAAQRVSSSTGEAIKLLPRTLKHFAFSSSI